MKYRQRWYIICVGGIIVVMIGILLMSKATWPLRNSPPGKIAFVSTKDDRAVIYLMETNGTHQLALTGDLQDASRPAWSPDGRYIAFVSDPTGLARSLWVMDADGSNKVELASALYEVYSYSWSPDGNHIAFSSRQNDREDIYVVHRDGSGLLNLTDHPAYDTSFSWSADSMSIAFHSRRGGNLEIYRVDRDGSNLTNLTNSPDDEKNPHWSPVSPHISFSSKGSIYIMNSDGANRRLLGQGVTAAIWSPTGDRILCMPGGTSLAITAMDGSVEARIPSRMGRRFSRPSWSPDGQHLLSKEIGSFPPQTSVTTPWVYSVLLSRTGRGRTSLGRHVGAYSWSPDGQYFAFSRGTGQEIEIFVRSANGRFEAQLTHNSWYDGTPAWQPQVP